MDDTGRVNGNSQSHDVATVHGDEDYYKDHDDTIVNNKNNNAPYLGESILTQIFMKTPIESLYNELRYACKPWFDTITNNSILHHSHQDLCHEPGFLAQYAHPFVSEERYNMYADSFTGQDLVEFRRGDMYDVFMYPSFTYLINFGEEGSIEEQVDLSPLFKDLDIMSCCNGLVLVRRKLRASLFSTLFVVNIVTKQRLMRLPPAKRWRGRTCSFVFIPSSGDYKVLLPTKDIDGIEILTLPAAVVAAAVAGGCTITTTAYGNDHLQWRFVEAPVKIATVVPPLAINGILYWVQPGGQLAYHLPYLLSFDATTEMFYNTPNPEFEFEPTRIEAPKIFSRHRAGFFELGGHLSLVSSRRHLSSWQKKVDIWVLKDGRNGEWIKQSTLEAGNNLINLINFSIHDQDYTMHVDRDPILSFRNGQLIILSFDKLWNSKLLIYDVGTDQSWKLDIAGNHLDLKSSERVRLFLKFYGSHVNSIVPLKNP